MRFLLNCLHASTSPSCQFCCLESFMLLYRVWSPQFPAFLLWKAFGMYHKPPEEKQRDSKFWAIGVCGIGFHLLCRPSIEKLPLSNCRGNFIQMMNERCDMRPLRNSNILNQVKLFS